MLAALPPKWEMQIPIITQQVSLEDLELNDVHEAIVAQYETEMNQGYHKQAQNAHKLSAIKHKCKHGNPSFNQQESQQQQQHCPSQSSSNPPGNQQQPRQHSTRGSGRGKAKGKGKQHEQPAHSHIASIAALPPPTSHTVAHIGSSSMTQHVISEPLS